jgi:two-component system, chemotaxis family, chemotaxis protein CheY
MRTDHHPADRTVMIVDDEAAVRQMLRMVLEASGYTVVAEANDGVEAVSRYLAVRPRVTLMDVCMPNMNGLDATREIVALDTHARIILVSGIHCENLAISAREAGARDALQKPVKIKVLKDVLARLVLM